MVMLLAWSKTCNHFSNALEKSPESIRKPKFSAWHLKSSLIYSKHLPKYFFLFHAPEILICIEFGFWKLIINYINNSPKQNQGFLRGSAVKHPPAMQEMQIWSLGWEDSLEEGMATRSSILTWRIPWTEEPGGLRPIGSRRIKHHCSDWAHTHAGRLQVSVKSSAPCIF